MKKKSHDPKPHAFVMISCHPGSHGGNLDTLRKIPEVIEAHAVYGIYDEMVRVKRAIDRNCILGPGNIFGAGAAASNERRPVRT